MSNFNYWFVALPILAVLAVIIGYKDNSVSRYRLLPLTTLGIIYGIVTGIVAFFMVAAESFYGVLSTITATEETGTLEDGLCVIVVVGLISAGYGALITALVAVGKKLSSRHGKKIRRTAAPCEALAALSADLPKATPVSARPNAGRLPEQKPNPGTLPRQSLNAERLSETKPNIGRLPAKTLDEVLIKTPATGTSAKDLGFSTQSRSITAFQGLRVKFGKNADNTKPDSVKDDTIVYNPSQSKTARPNTGRKAVPPLCPGGDKVCISIPKAYELLKLAERNGDNFIVFDAPVVKKDTEE